MGAVLRIKLLPKNCMLQMSLSSHLSWTLLNFSFIKITTKQKKLIFQVNTNNLRQYCKCKLELNSLPWPSETILLICTIFNQGNNSGKKREFKINVCTTRSYWITVVCFINALLFILIFIILHYYTISLFSINLWSFNSFVQPVCMCSQQTNCFILEKKKSIPITY